MTSEIPPKCVQWASLGGGATVRLPSRNLEGSRTVRRRARPRRRCGEECDARGPLRGSTRCAAPAQRARPPSTGAAAAPPPFSQRGRRRVSLCAARALTSQRRFPRTPRCRGSSRRRSAPSAPRPASPRSAPRTGAPGAPCGRSRSPSPRRPTRSPRRSRGPGERRPPRSSPRWSPSCRGGPGPPRTRPRGSPARATATPRSRATRGRERRGRPLWGRWPSNWGGARAMAPRVSSPHPGPSPPRAPAEAASCSQTLPPHPPASAVERPRGPERLRSHPRSVGLLGRWR
mmetsp:Transcript_61387/g.169875  ORF Transcript_61387/g.169875 Transcript_61387/m.169875 type:complete len:288 (+) Transcript_61387:69-932(+)